MAKLPIISGVEAVKAFNKAGWFVARHTARDQRFFKNEGNR